MKQFTPLTTFLLGLMIGAGLYRSYRHQQDEKDAAYFESLSHSWNGEDPLPADLFRPYNADDTLAQQIADEARRVAEQKMEDIRKRAAAQVLFGQPQAAKDHLDRNLLIIEGTGKTPEQIADEIKERVSERISELAGAQRQPATPEPGDKN